MITPEQIKTLSDKFQIDQFSILREYIQLIFLKYLYQIKESQRIWFKGGTAIHFLFGSFRFSEDLDFTVTMDTATTKRVLNKAMEGVSSEIEGIEMVNKGIRNHSLTEILKYDKGLKFPLTIKLDFSLREKPISSQASPIETVFPISPYPLVTHMNAEELMAEKIRALIMRRKGRDVFDLWFMLSKEIKIREDYIKNKMLWCRKKYDEAELLYAVEKFSEKELELDLKKFLPRQYGTFIKDLKNNVLAKLTKELSS